MASRRPEGFPRELLTSDETILLELKPSAVPFVIAPALAMSTIIVVFLLGFASLAVVSIPLAIRSCGLPLVVFAILLVITSYIGYLTWLNTFYAVTDKRVLQKSGLIGMNAFDAPLASIQNVTLMQPFFFKLFGVGTIVFSTSGTGGGAAMQRAPDRRHPDVLREVRGTRELRGGDEAEEPVPDLRDPPPARGTLRRPPHGRRGARPAVRGRDCHRVRNLLGRLPCPRGPPVLLLLAGERQGQGPPDDRGHPPERAGDRHPGRGGKGGEAPGGDGGPDLRIHRGRV